MQTAAYGEQKTPEHRGEVRMPVRQRPVLSFVWKQQRFEGMICDLSTMGLGLLVDDANGVLMALKAGDPVSLYFPHASHAVAAMVAQSSSSVYRKKPYLRIGMQIIRNHQGNQRSFERISFEAMRMATVLLSLPYDPQQCIIADLIEAGGRGLSFLVSSESLAVFPISVTLPCRLFPFSEQELAFEIEIIHSRLDLRGRIYGARIVSHGRELQQLIDQHREQLLASSHSKPWIALRRSWTSFLTWLWGLWPMKKR